MTFSVLSCCYTFTPNKLKILPIVLVKLVSRVLTEGFKVGVEDWQVQRQNSIAIMAPL